MRTFRFTFAALPRFVDTRRTGHPTILLLFSLGLVAVLAILFGGVAYILCKRDRQRMEAAMEKRQHEEKVMRIAKETHERTIAYACHQLRNPLQTVMGSLEMMTELLRGDERVCEDLAAMAAGTRDMKRVIDDVVNWMRVSVGKLELKPTPTDLRAMLRQLVS